MMNIAVIFAGGVGIRMRSKELPKQFMKLHEKEIIVHTLEVWDRHEEIDAIVIACIEEWIPHTEELIRKYNIRKVRKIVPGGPTGQMSIYQGLLAAEEIAGKEEAIVLIHDGVRPLIDSEVISKNIVSVKQYGNAITTSKVMETIMSISNQNEIDYIPNRANSRLARAPQSFWLRDVIKFYRMALEEGRSGFVDTCSMMAHYKQKLFLVDGPQENIKVTTPSDYYMMRAILDARENEQIYPI